MLQVEIVGVTQIKDGLWFGIVTLRFFNWTGLLPCIEGVASYHETPIF